MGRHGRHRRRGRGGGGGGLGSAEVVRSRLDHSLCLFVPMSSAATATATAPPEVEATLTRLASYKNVQGVLILARPNGIILRSTGSLFALPPAAAPANDEESAQPNGEDDVLVPTTSELARRYVEAVAAEVKDVDEDQTDDVRFLRIRTKRHELIV